SLACASSQLFSPLYQEGLNQSFKLGARIWSWIVPLGKGGQSLLASMASLETLGGFLVKGLVLIEFMVYTKDLFLIIKKQIIFSYKQKYKEKSSPL
ncbi:MAG: hypothetical protein LBD50_00090, partial [Rickettsiales bacterium]|nr:hypothetical protein [Rickettsiales bacterium]